MTMVHWAALVLALVISDTTAVPVVGSNNTNAVLPPYCPPSTRIVGDGNPHQNYYHIQVTEGIDCGNGDCSVAHLTSHTIGWSVTGSVNPVEWLTGGFSVSESYTTGNSYTCSGHAGGSVCVWQSIAHTAYTAINVNVQGCGTPHSDDIVIRSPNDNEVGYEYYCVRDNFCRNNGDGYWSSYAPAGGPGPKDLEGN